MILLRLVLFGAGVLSIGSCYAAQITSGTVTVNSSTIESHLFGANFTIVTGGWSSVHVQLCEIFTSCVVRTFVGGAEVGSASVNGYSYSKASPQSVVDLSGGLEFTFTPTGEGPYTTQFTFVGGFHGLSGIIPNPPPPVSISLEGGGYVTTRSHCYPPRGDKVYCESIGQVFTFEPTAIPEPSNALLTAAFLGFILRRISARPLR